eukprot:768272-Hanusia_phi.AAC.9
MLEAQVAGEFDAEQIYQWEEDERYYDLIAAKNIEESNRGAETGRTWQVTPHEAQQEHIEDEVGRSECGCEWAKRADRRSTSKTSRADCGR